MAFGMKNINKPKSLSVREQKENRIQMSFTIPNSFMKKLNKAAKKGTKTKVLEINLEKVYDPETKEFIFDTDFRNKDPKVTLNSRLDADMAKAFKKLAKKHNKTNGELLIEIFKYLDDNES